MSFCSNFGFKDRLSLINNSTPPVEEVVRLYVTKYPTTQPDNVYTEMTEQDKNTLEKKVLEGINTYISIN